MTDQTFTSPQDGSWLKIDFLPGVELLPLAQPVPDGSIHKARLAKGTIIPVHTHPADRVRARALWHCRDGRPSLRSRRILVDPGRDAPRAACCSHLCRASNSASRRDGQFRRR
jgi:hypothetical protein